MHVPNVHLRSPSRRTLAVGLSCVLASLFGSPSVTAQTVSADPSYDPTAATETVPLWSGRAPGAVGDEPADRPSLTVFRPFGRRATDPPRGAVIVFPGGGYVFLAANHEGRQVANYLNSLGLTAFVLRYRVAPRYHDPVPMLDAQRAIRFVRAHAAEYGVRPDQIGVLGFSAGGHLAATVATHFDDGRADAADSVDRAGSRPDFFVLGYPVVSFVEPFAHRGSADNLLGRGATDAQLAEHSPERHVTPRTPPAFLVHTSADDGVPTENSVTMYLALRKAHVPAELHVFAHGAHGLGLGGGEPGFEEWPRLLAIWLRGQGVLPVASR
jgi:acetyl esterase/lipase